MVIPRVVHEGTPLSIAVRIIAIPSRESLGWPIWPPTIPISETFAPVRPTVQYCVPPEHPINASALPAVIDTIAPTRATIAMNRRLVTRLERSPQRRILYASGFRLEPARRSQALRSIPWGARTFKQRAARVGGPLFFELTVLQELARRGLRNARCFVLSIARARSHVLSARLGPDLVNLAIDLPSTV